MEEIMKLIEETPALKEAYDKLVELKGKLTDEEIVAFIQEHMPSLGEKGELSEDDLDGVAGGSSLSKQLGNAMDKIKNAMKQMNPGVIGTGPSLLGDLLKKKQNDD